ncbi:MAG: ATPase P [Tissierellia bacterium]|nr:ATPase P [Tissierellia bacterium]
MIIYEIPGRENIQIDNVVFDYNGTIAVDGKLIEVIGELFEELERYANIYILTADTYGTVVEECRNIPGKVLTFPGENAGESKRNIIKKLGSNKTLVVGNGFNDILMFEEGVLSIAIMEGEGTSGKLLYHADIVSRNIIEAINIILNKNKVKATLRN